MELTSKCLEVKVQRTKPLPENSPNAGIDSALSAGFWGHLDLKPIATTKTKPGTKSLKT